jgi:hypothetical protein
MEAVLNKAVDGRKELRERKGDIESCDAWSMSMEGEK